MRQRRLLLCALFLLAGASLFASGSGEKKAEPAENTWTLCITAFDASALPPSRAALAAAVERRLAFALDGLDYKLRNVKEYDYYWMRAWQAAQTKIAAQVAAKQAERDKLVFAGYAPWRYRREYAKKDEELTALRELLHETRLTSPDISMIPRFVVTDDNKNGTFPAPPEKGGEYFFCTDKKVNGFLSGSVSLYHERILLEIKVWTVWSRTYRYRDRILFSIQDIAPVFRELASKLINELSGMEPAALEVTATPADATIVVDDDFAGAGKTEPIKRTPGPVNVTVYADKHHEQTATVELDAGERVNLDFTLPPVKQGAFTVRTADGTPAAVYKGAEYVGPAPITLTGPLGDFSQASVETPDGKGASLAFRIDDKSSNVMLTPTVPPDGGRVEDARSGFYGAFGRFWVGVPVAAFLFGMSNTYIATNNIDAGSHYDKAVKWTYVQYGSLIAIGLLATDVVVRLCIYIYQANKPAPILTPKK